MVAFVGLVLHLFLHSFLHSFCTHFALILHSFFFSGSNVVLVGDEDDLLVQCAEGLLACLSSVGPWPYAYLPVLPFQHVSSMATAMLGYKYLIGYNIKHEYEQKLKHRQLAADGEQSDGGGDGGGINPDEEGDEDEDIPPNSKCFSCDWCICGLFVRFLMLVRGVLFLLFFVGIVAAVFSQLPFGVMVVDLRYGSVQIKTDSGDIGNGHTSTLLPRSRDLEIALRTSLRPKLFSLDGLNGYEQFVKGKTVVLVVVGWLKW